MRQKRASHWAHPLPSNSAVACTATDSNHRLQSQTAITYCNHRLQSPTTITDCTHRLQSPTAITVTDCNHRLQSPTAITDCNHPLQSPTAIEEQITPSKSRTRLLGIILFYLECPSLTPPPLPNEDRLDP